jgi:hypothetical protein
LGRLRHQNPGATFTVTRKKLLPVAQAYYNHVVVDYDWRVWESDKNNNECWHWFERGICDVVSGTILKG